MILFQSWVIIEYMDFSSKTTDAMNNGIKERPFDFYGGAIKIFRKKKIQDPISQKNYSVRN